MHRWLSNQVVDLGEQPEVLQFRSGASNLTYLLRYADRELVLRRPPRGNKAASAHDMKREVTIQQRVRPYFPYVPQIVAFCDDESVIGADFYVMERMNGSILRGDAQLSEPTSRSVGERVIEGLVQLHQVDVAQAGLADLGKGPGYVTRQVEGWSRRYRAALTDDVPDAENVMQWLAANQPDDVAQCLIHGDWRLDNVVLDLDDEPTLVGVLDWELATVGDPLMDLGSAMAYWINADDEPFFASLKRQPTDLPGMPTREEFIERYLRLTHRSTDFTFYEVFGLFRLAVIIQQIWARYRAGQTTNPAFADFGMAVNVLIHRAGGVMQ